MVKPIKTNGAYIVAAAVFVVATAGATGAFAQQSPATNETQPAVSEQVSDDAPSAKERAEKARLIFSLSTLHGAPTREQLDAAGSAVDVAALLREIVADQAARPSMRLRALDALGHFSDRESVDFLERTIETPSTLEVRRAEHTQLLRQHAMISYARIRGEAAVETLARFLAPDRRLDNGVGEQADATDLQLRLTAISALGRFGGQAGRVELDKLRGQIEHPALRRSLNKFVAPTSQ